MASTPSFRTLLQSTPQEGEPTGRSKSHLLDQASQAQGALVDGEGQARPGGFSPPTDPDQGFEAPRSAPPSRGSILSPDPAWILAAGPKAQGEGRDSSPVDLDAITPRYHLLRCGCRACNGGLVGPGGDSAVPATGTPTAAPGPAASLQTLANYLRLGYWQAAGTIPRQFNLGSTGTNPNSGEIRYNLSGWNFDTDGNGTLDGDPDGLTTARRDLVREVFKLYQATLGIRFVETTATDTSVDIFFTDNDPGSAYAYTAGSTSSSGIDYSVINVSSDWYSGLSGFDTYTVQTVLHEVGHVLGLGHQGLYNGTGAYATDAVYANDSWQASMMSYFSQTQNPTTGASYAFLQSPMSVDWLALDDIYRSYGYGIANAFNGDTTYGVGTTISPLVSRLWNEFSTYADTTAYTIVDASGYDTLDVSNFTAPQWINLAPSQAGSTTPSISNIGGSIGNLTLGVGTVIEAAIGGTGNDNFFGNAAANTFRGGGGDDSFTDSFGSDIYFGDAGTDSLSFTESLDLFRYQLSGDSLLFSRVSGVGDIDQVWNGLETLFFNGLATTYQQLVNNLAGPVLPGVTIMAVNGNLTSGASTSTTALNFSGSLSQALGTDQTIAVYRNGVQVGTASPTAPGATTWSFSLQEQAGSNSFTYTARVVEGASGRLGTLSNAFVLTVDTVAPVVTVNALDTVNTTPLLSGTVSEANATVTVTIGALTRTAVTNGSGGWTLQWNDTLAAGQTYDLVVRATDPAGNSGTDITTGELIIRADDFSANTSTTGAVPMGTSRTGVVEVIGDRDWFAIDLQAGRSYDFRLNNAGLADPLLRLRNSVGTELANNDDISSTNFNSLISYTASSSGRYYLEAGAFNDAGTGAYTIAAADVTPVAGTPLLYLSLQSAVTLPSASVMNGLTANTNDILAFDGTRFTTWMNGNASGLAGATLRDFHIVSPDEVVVAFVNPVILSGIAFDSSDLARLTRTAGVWSVSMLFDGSDVGLTTNAETIDAVTRLPNGNLVISTRGSGSVPGVSAFAAEDLLSFTPSTLGANTAGAWSIYADMSDVGITGASENVAATDVSTDGRVFLSTTGNALATASGTSVSAANEDVFVFQPSSLGSLTSGSYPPPLYFDGSLYGLGANAVQGLDVPV